MRRRVDMFAALCLAGATLSWGATPVFLKALTSDVPDGYTANAVRYPLACIFYLPLLVRGWRRGAGKGFWLAALLPSAVNLIGQTLWGVAAYHVSAGMISFLLRLSAVWGILGAFWLFPDERELGRSKRFWTGTALALAGFMTMSWTQATQLGGTTGTGLVIMFFCAICYGAYGVTVRYVMGNRNPLFVFAVVGTYTSIGLLVMAPIGRPESLLHLSAKPWGLLVASAIIGISLAHGMYYAAVQRIGAAVSTLMLCVTPFVTILGSSIFLGERFSIGQWVGGCVLVGGASLAVSARQHLPRHPAPDPRETANE